MALTQGAILAIFDERPIPNAIVQVTDFGRIPASGEGSTERYVIMISDGSVCMKAVLTAPANSLAESGQVVAGTIISIDSHKVVQSKTTKVAIISALTIHQAEAPLIGTPTPVTQIRNAKGDGSMNDSNRSTARPGGYGAAFGSSHPTSSAPAGGDQRYLPISSLNPWNIKWTIKARVTNKSDIRTWSNAKGDGKLFSVDLLDSHGGQIRATMYTTACDKFFPVFAENRVYTISGASVKPSRKQYTRLPHEYELVIDEGAEVNPVQDDHTIKSVQFTAFKNFEEIKQMPVAGNNNNNSYNMPQGAQDPLVDVVGVVTQVKPLATIVSKKTQKNLVKREIVLADQCLLTIELTLWGEQAEKYNEDVLAGNPVIAVKSCRVSEFMQGKNLSSSFSSQIFVNPDIPEAKTLANWYHSAGKDSTFYPIAEPRSGGFGGGGSGGSTERKSLGDINDAEVSISSNGIYYTVRAAVSLIRADLEKNKLPWYNSCPGCKKKIIQDGAKWVCDTTCHKSYDEPIPNYVFSFLAADYRSTRWLNVFGAQGDVIFGMTASDLARLAEQDREGFNRAVRDVTNHQFEFRIRAKMDHNGETPAVRCTVISVKPVDFVEESRLLLKELSV